MENKFKDRFTTLDQSLRLKELGVEQEIKVGDFFQDEHHFCFVNSDDDLRLCGKIDGFQEDGNNSIHSIKDTVKFFDGSQIDEMLPKDGYQIDGWHPFNNFSLSHYNGIYSCCFVDQDNKTQGYMKGKGDTKLKAKTNLLINLLENGIIPVS